MCNFQYLPNFAEYFLLLVINKAYEMKRKNETQLFYLIIQSMRIYRSIYIYQKILEWFKYCLQKGIMIIQERNLAIQSHCVTADTECIIVIIVFSFVWFLEIVIIFRQLGCELKTYDCTIVIWKRCMPLGNKI